MSTEPQPTQTPRPAEPGPASDHPRLDGPQHHKIRRTRISGLWFAVVFFAVLLLFLLIFILQNERKVDISYLGAHGHLPLGVALLLAAVCGVLLAILAGAARMAQLHSVARKHRRADARRAPADQGSLRGPGRCAGPPRAAGRGCAPGPGLRANRQSPPTRRACPIIVVDSGFMVDPVHHRPPDQPQNPDRPRKSGGKG